MSDDGDLAGMLHREMADAFDRFVGGTRGVEFAAAAANIASVTKVGLQVPISTEMAMDYGLIPDTRPPFVPTRRQRFRWWRQDRLGRVRMRLASWIAGFDVEDRD